MNHGGKRKGAGRKPAPETRKIKVGYKLAKDIVEYLRSRDNATEVIELAIRRSKGFREWNGSRK